MHSSWILLLKAVSSIMLFVLLIGLGSTQRAYALDIAVTFEGTAWDAKRKAVFNEVVELWEKQLQGSQTVQLKVSLTPLSGSVQGWG